MKFFLRFFSMVVLGFVATQTFAIDPNEAINQKTETEIRIPATKVKNQSKSNTCWSFATISLIESEVYRKSGVEMDLSEMFIVRKVYKSKADRFIRMHGNINFAGGGEPNDVFDIIKGSGLMPEIAYSGLISDSGSHNHIELEESLKKYVEGIVKSPSKRMENWQEVFNKMLDDYLTQVPDSFLYNGHYYTSKSFTELLDINPDDYVLLSSFTHHPFYTPFILEVPDNWSWGEVYNLPLKELLQTVDFALKNGYSLTWSADVSEPCFNFNEGVATVPIKCYKANTKSNKKAKCLSDSHDGLSFSGFKKPLEEIMITEQVRQNAFDNYSTTDDHTMHLTGLKEINGKHYYIVKNSWGTNNKYNGYIYVSSAYFKYKTISIMLHKDAIPINVKEKLHLTQLN